MAGCEVHEMLALPPSPVLLDAMPAPITTHAGISRVPQDQHHTSRLTLGEHIHRARVRSCSVTPLALWVKSEWEYMVVMRWWSIDFGAACAAKGKGAQRF